MRGASAVAGHFGNGAGVTGEMLAQEMRCGKAIRSSFLGREDEAFGWVIATGVGRLACDVAAIPPLRSG
jgi:hypothetical protein